jgi:hypothetical protein
MAYLELELGERVLEIDGTSQDVLIPIQFSAEHYPIEILGITDAHNHSSLLRERIEITNWCHSRASFQVLVAGG